MCSSDLATGPCMISSSTGSDPSSLVTGTFGVMALPVLLLIMHGPVATNILNLYSCSLAALSVGVRIERWKLTAIAGAVASAVLAVFVQADSFAQAFDHWMVSILVWISPWAAIVLVHFFVLERGRIDVAELYRDGDEVHRPAMIGLGLGLVAGWAWQYGMVPALQGPIARALGDTDFSWLSGGLVAGGLYYLLATRARARVRAGRAAEPVVR